MADGPRPRFICRSCSDTEETALFEVLGSSSALLTLSVPAPFAFSAHVGLLQKCPFARAYVTVFEESGLEDASSIVSDSDSAACHRFCGLFSQGDNCLSGEAFEEVSEVSLFALSDLTSTRLGLDVVLVIIPDGWFLIISRSSPDNGPAANEVSDRNRASPERSVLV